MSDDRVREVHHYHHVVPAPCNGHHCYHTQAGQMTGNLCDTYAGSYCCRCGAAEPNPYENERR